jgi:hypothetical protein
MLVYVYVYVYVCVCVCADGAVVRHVNSGACSSGGPWVYVPGLTRASDAGVRVLTICPSRCGSYPEVNESGR